MSQLHSNPTGTGGSVPDAPADDELKGLLTDVRRIAVIGASTRDGRPANYVPAYLAGQGYDVVGVNPGATGEQLFGNKVVGSLRRKTFTRSTGCNEDIPGHLDDILALDPLPRAVWIQLGLRHDETAQALRAKGITVIQDRCLMVEHRRLLGNRNG